MPDTILETNTWPVNELGEILVQTGVGTNTVVGYVPSISTPSDPTTNKAVFKMPFETAPSYTWASIPAASGTVRRVFLTDIGGGTIWLSNGTRWYPENKSIIIYTTVADNPQTLGTAKVMAQNLIPAGLWQDRDKLRITYTYCKAAGTETCTHNFRLGTAGTTADTSLGTTGAPGSTNVSVGNVIEFQRLSATSVRRNGTGVIGGMVGTSTTAFAAAVTVSSLDTNPMYMSLTSVSSANVEIYTLYDYRVELIAGV